MEKATIKQDSSAIYYPPGGLLIWFLIILELFTFLGAVLIFIHYRHNNLEIFKHSKDLLNPIIGTVNTILLISSGVLMALSVNKLRENDTEKSSKLILFALLIGALFLVLKSVEYYHKIELGVGLNYNDYFTFYWLMTGFHYVHVLFGLGLLTYMYGAVKNKKYNARHMLDLESSAAYWHMCDLIWILIFPILYLL